MGSLSSPQSADSSRTAVVSIARETETTVDLVQALYQEAVERLSSEATFKGYIDVLAIQRVRRQLREIRAG